MGRRRRRRSNDSVLGLIVLGCLFISSYISKITGIGLTASFVIIGIGLTALIIYLKYRERQRFLQSGITEIDNMTGIEFEKCLMHHFNKLGYKAETTAISHDYGADLIMRNGDEKIIVQAKRYNGKVGIKAIQEAIGAMAYYGSDRGIVVTNSYYTPNAKNLAYKSNVELWDRDIIIHTFNIKEDHEAHETSDKQDCVEVYAINKEECPRCGKMLVKRNGRRGKFYGCSGYPNCKFTKDIR